MRAATRPPRLTIEGPALDAEGTRPRRIEVDITTGRIAKVAEPEGKARIALHKGQVLLPGLVDLHVHAREDTSGKEVYKEDFRTAGEAALHGGVVAFADMPNNHVPPVDAESYEKKRELARRAPVDVLLFAGIGPATRPLPFPAPYKVYMGPSIGPLFFETLDQLHSVLPAYRGQWLAFHAEAPEVLRDNRDRPTHAERRPPEAEVKAVEYALGLARQYEFNAHICHLSTAGGMDMIRAARKRGQQVTCEVAPHHLFFELESIGASAKPGYLQCNPPIRPRRDRLGLLEAVKSGEIDFLASDHAPHSLEENERGISGMPHLDTLGPFLFWLHGEGVSWERIAAIAAVNPGRILERFLGEPFGRFEEGAVGSFTILQARHPITIRRTGLRTRARWSPFEGVTFSGRVSHTIVRGKVHQQGHL